MTTWTNTKINKVIRNTHGSLWEVTYVITGVSGDTGGTLTPKDVKRIINAAVSAYKDDGSAACASLTWRFSSGAAPTTVTVAYSDPVAAHTVRITVWGYRK